MYVYCTGPLRTFVSLLTFVSIMHPNSIKYQKEAQNLQRFVTDIHKNISVFTRWFISFPRVSKDEGRGDEASPSGLLTPLQFLLEAPEE